MSDRLTAPTPATISVCKFNLSGAKTAIFTVLAYHKNGARLTGEAIRRLVDGLCKQAGIRGEMSSRTETYAKELISRFEYV